MNLNKMTKKAIKYWSRNWKDLRKLPKDIKKASKIITKKINKDLSKNKKRRK